MQTLDLSEVGETEQQVGYGGGYENSPACVLLATNCCCCGRPLVDCESVEYGIGPDCRKKYGWGIEVSPEVRSLANKLVHDAAARRDDRMAVLQATAKLRELGFENLAAKIEDRAATVKIVVEGPFLVVSAPYSEEATIVLRKVPGRRWDKARRANLVPMSSKGALWQALQVAYKGCTALGPKGPFTI